MGKIGNCSEVKCPLIRGKMSPDQRVSYHDINLSLEYILYYYIYTLKS